MNKVLFILLSIFPLSAISMEVGKESLIPLFQSDAELFVDNTSNAPVEITFELSRTKKKETVPANSGLYKLGLLKNIGDKLTVNNTPFDFSTTPIKPTVRPRAFALPKHNVVLKLSAPYTRVGSWGIETEWIKPQEHELAQSIIEIKRRPEKEVGKLSIVNKSTWPLLVTYVIDNKEIKRVLRNTGELFGPGLIENISKITIALYGQYLGYAGRPYEVEMGQLKRDFKDKKQDLTFEIDAGYTGWFPQENWGVWAANPTEFTLPVSKNPFDAFKEAAKRRAGGQSIDARHILGLPDNYTKDDVARAFKELSLRWHPDKHKEDTLLATKITQKITDAKDKLLEKLTNTQASTEMQ